MLCQVMIVGNHSAGKSSFINWYIGEGIQKTVREPIHHDAVLPACALTADFSVVQGVAIETRGFTFVTSGKKRETLTGDATVSLLHSSPDCVQF